MVSNLHCIIEKKDETGRTKWRGPGICVEEEGIGGRVFVEREGYHRRSSCRESSCRERDDGTRTITHCTSRQQCQQQSIPASLTMWRGGALYFSLHHPLFPTIPTITIHLQMTPKNDWTRCTTQMRHSLTHSSRGVGHRSNQVSDTTCPGLKFDRVDLET